MSPVIAIVLLTSLGLDVVVIVQIPAQGLVGILVDSINLTPFLESIRKRR